MQEALASTVPAPEDAFRDDLDAFMRTGGGVEEHELASARRRALEPLGLPTVTSNNAAAFDASVSVPSKDLLTSLHVVKVDVPVGRGASSRRSVGLPHRIRLALTCAFIWCRLRRAALS